MPFTDELRLRAETFPADRSRLVADAVAAPAPVGLVANLRALPDNHLFGSAEQMASALQPSTQERLEP